MGITQIQAFRYAKDTKDKKITSQSNKSNSTNIGHLFWIGLRSAIFVTLAIFLMIAATAVFSRKWEVSPILSGSMRPGLPLGGIVIAQRVPVTSLKVRDVVLFHPPTEPKLTFVHRIISLKHTPQGLMMRTQGDANLFPDPWHSILKGKWAYRARYSVPFLGYVGVWEHSPSGRQDILLLAGGLAVVLVGLVVKDTITKRQAKQLEALGEADDTDSGALDHRDITQQIDVVSKDEANLVSNDKETSNS